EVRRRSSIPIKSDETSNLRTDNPTPPLGPGCTYRAAYLSAKRSHPPAFPCSGTDNIRNNPGFARGTRRAFRRPKRPEPELSARTTPPRSAAPKSMLQRSNKPRPFAQQRLRPFRPRTPSLTQAAERPAKDNGAARL